MAIRVKGCKVKGLSAYGITDGKKWFFYAYKTKERAEKMLPIFTTEEVIRVNIAHDNPPFFLVETEEK